LRLGYGKNLRNQREVDEMEVRRFNRAEFLQLLRDEGVVLGYTVLSFRRFITLCKRYGFNSNEFGFLFF